MNQQQTKNILPSGSDTRSSIELIKGEYLGFRSSDGEIEITIENSGFCCESWGFKIDGKEISDIKNLPKYDDIEITMYNGITTNDKGEIHLTMTCDDYDDYDIVIWCEHNGYYSHNVRMRWPDHESTERL